MKNVFVLLLFISIILITPYSSNAASTPTVTTDSVVNIYKSTITGVGTLTDDGDSTVIEIGFCYNTTGTPTVTDGKTYKTEAISENSYYLDISGLSNGTSYYIRAYAENTSGVGYGEVLTFATLPGYNDEVLDYSFQPLFVYSGTISDESSYGNDASYTLASMIDGITVFAMERIIGQFYPEQGDIDLSENRWIVPSQAGMTQKGSSSNLPLYDLFKNTADETGMDVAYLYMMIVFAMSMGFGFLFFLISGSVSVSIIGMIIMLAGFFTTGIMPLWVIIFFAAFAFGMVYIARQS